MMGMEQNKVVFQMKGQPPINFNIALKMHAMQHGLTITNMGVHITPISKHISVDLSGPLANAKQFANSAVSKFGVFIQKAEVSAGNQGIFKR